MVDIVGEPEAIDKLFQALVKLQEPVSKITTDKKVPVGRDGKSHFEYATFPNVMRHLRPLLAEEGLFLTQAMTSSPVGPGYQRLMTMLVGKGARYSTMLDFQPATFMEGTYGSVGQRLGNCWGYLRRMAVQNLFMLSPDQDDGAGRDADEPSEPNPRKQATPPAAGKGRAGKGRKTAPDASGNVPPPEPAQTEAEAEAAIEHLAQPPPLPTPKPATEPTTGELAAGLAATEGKAAEEPEKPEKPKKEDEPKKITDSQRSRLRDLLAQVGLKQLSAINSYIAGLLSKKWNARNLDEPHAATLILSLQELAKSRKAMDNG